MKWFYWSLVILFCTTAMFCLGIGVDNLRLTTNMYKNALDSGADAAARYRAYDTEEYVYNQSLGFGIGLEDKNNIKIDKDESLKWFYRLLFRNLSIDDPDMQDKMKRYLPMKALICFDRLEIADAEDIWVYDSQYMISYRGKPYMFTLSDQIFDISASTWVRGEDIGLTEAERKSLLSGYIIDELNLFIENRKNRESGKRYKLAFSLNDMDSKRLSGISGVNFIVFCEGLPLPSYNPFKKDYLYVYGLGGSEIIRQ